MGVHQIGCERLFESPIPYHQYFDCGVDVCAGCKCINHPPTHEAVERFGSVEAAVWWVAIGRAVAFLMGSLFSYTVGYVGMNVAVEGNVRVAAAAAKGIIPHFKLPIAQAP